MHFFEVLKVSFCIIFFSICHSSKLLMLGTDRKYISSQKINEIEEDNILHKVFIMNSMLLEDIFNFTSNNSTKFLSDNNLKIEKLLKNKKKSFSIISLNDFIIRNNQQKINNSKKKLDLLIKNSFLDIENIYNYFKINLLTEINRSDNKKYYIELFDEFFHKKMIKFKNFIEERKIILNDIITEKKNVSLNLYNENNIRRFDLFIENIHSDLFHYVEELKSDIKIENHSNIFILINEIGLLQLMKKYNISIKKYKFLILMYENKFIKIERKKSLCLLPYN